MIRKYKQEDKLTLLNIFKLNTPQYFDPSEFADFSNFLEQNPATYFTLEEQNTVIGGFGYSINQIDSSGSITWILIHPDHTGHGYGKLAIDHCHTHLFDNPSVKTLIAKTSQHAYKFFESLGYKLVRTETDYWGKGLDLYLMQQAV